MNIFYKPLFLTLNLIILSCIPDKGQLSNINDSDINNCMRSVLWIAINEADTIYREVYLDENQYFIYDGRNDRIHYDQPRKPEDYDLFFNDIINDTIFDTLKFSKYKRHFKFENYTYHYYHEVSYSVSVDRNFKSLLNREAFYNQADRRFWEYMKTKDNDKDSNDPDSSINWLPPVIENYEGVPE